MLSPLFAAFSWTTWYFRFLQLRLQLQAILTDFSGRISSMDKIHNLETHSVIMLKSIKWQNSKIFRRFFLQIGKSVRWVFHTHTQKRTFTKSNVVFIRALCLHKMHIFPIINTLFLFVLQNCVHLLFFFLFSIDQRVSNSICCFWQQTKSRCDLRNRNPFTYTKAEIL